MKEKVKDLEESGAISFENFYISRNFRNGKYGVFMHTDSSGLHKYVSIDSIEQIANQLLDLVEEIRNREKFRIEDDYFSVMPNGEIAAASFCGNWIDYFCMISGNIFRTKEEAEAHKEEILATFEEAMKKYVR